MAYLDILEHRSAERTRPDGVSVLDPDSILEKGRMLPTPLVPSTCRLAPRSRTAWLD